MTHIRHIRGWHSPPRHRMVYERLLQSIGTDAFGSAVRDSVFSSTAGARRIYLFEATGRSHSSLHYFFGEPGLAKVFPAYRRWYQQQDPVCDAYDAAPGCSDMVLQRLRPSAIPSPEFRRRVFDDAGIVERVSIVQRGPDAWRAMNVSRHASDHYFSDRELGELIGLACLILPMLPLHRSRSSVPLAITVAELEDRFASRCAALTRRERQVCARAAFGMSVEATANDLRIAKTSVLTYRQRAYQRLRVSSPFELCAMVAH